VVDCSLFSGFAGAMRAAIEVVAHLDAVPDNAAVTVLANRRQHVDRAFERVKGMRLSVENDVESAFVSISAVFARFHESSVQK
jgi:hypothetical protein